MIHDPQPQEPSERTQHFARDARPCARPRRRHHFRRHAAGHARRASGLRPVVHYLRPGDGCLGRRRDPARRTEKAVSARRRRRTLLAGLLLVFGFPVMSSIAMQTVPAAHGGVVLGILPLATSIFAALIGGERPSVAVLDLRRRGRCTRRRCSPCATAACSCRTGDIWLLLAGLAGEPRLRRVRPAVAEDAGLGGDLLGA